MSATTTAATLRLRRLSWRPRFFVGRALLGLLMGVGGLVYAQQSGKVYPTAANTAIWIIGGVLLAQVLGNVGSAISVSRANARIARAERDLGPRLASTPAVPGAVSAVPPVSSAAASWRPTHTVPAGGLDTRSGPDAALPVESRLDPWLEVRVTGSQGTWTHIECSNGYSAWVEGSGLQPVAG